MIIPRSFKIFGVTYKVEQPRSILYKGEQHMGLYDPDTATIKVRRNLRKDIKEMTFIHELTHAILLTLEYHDLGRDEIFIERVSKALHQVLTTQE